MSRAALRVLGAAALALGGCGDGEPRPLTVSAAASLKAALTEYAEPYGARLSFAGSDELAAQIRRGAGPDVFAAADTALPAALHEEGLVERPVVFATNELVLAVPARSPVESLGDLGRDGVRIAAGAPSVPVGAYAEQVLERLAPSARANIRSREPDVSGIVAKLTQGAVDAGFVYRTDVDATGGRLRAIALPQPLRPRVEYSAAVVRDGERPAVARRFVAGLPGAPELRAAGFGEVR